MDAQEQRVFELLAANKAIRQQRNDALDDVIVKISQLALSGSKIGELEARVADLEKQLEDTKKTEQR